MLKRIERLLRQGCGIEPGALLIAGVSGGPDSLCLLHVLQALGHRLIVAHFDHQLRPGSAEDAAHVAKIAAAQGLAFVAGRGDVAAFSSSKRMSVEGAGRSLRYAFLFAQARAHGAIAVAVGHTADDQAETILMHLLRGSGLAGLAGMRPRVVLPDLDGSSPIVRPLLEVQRQETLEYCRLHDLRALHDASNESREYLRNRVRLELIPSLEAYNPQVRQALVRLSNSAAEDLVLIEDILAQAWKRTLMDQGRDYLGFDAARFATEAPALQRRLVMRASLQLQPGIELDFDGLRRAEGFISDPSSRRLQLGEELMLVRESGTIYIALGEQHLPSDKWPQLPAESVGLGRGAAATVALAGNWQFTSELADRESDAAGQAPAQDPYRGRLDADSLPSQLELRAPRSGDRIKPLGLQGHTQKLSDVFINIGVPERLRARWPVLASGDDVVWIPGFRIAEPFRVRKETRRTVLVAVYRRG
jgi:tRNA(Ile)-lysidine synthase